MTEGLIDFGDRSIKPMAILLDELHDLIAEDLDALGTEQEFAALRGIAETGTSADRQRRHLADTWENGHRAVVRHLIEEFHMDL